MELEKQQVILEPEDKLCPTSGQERPRIGQEVTTEYDYVPAKLIIREIVRPKYGALSKALLPGSDDCSATASAGAAKQAGAGIGGLPLAQSF